MHVSSIHIYMKLRGHGNTVLPYLSNSSQSLTEVTENRVEHWFDISMKLSILNETHCNCTTRKHYKDKNT